MQSPLTWFYRGGSVSLSPSFRIAGIVNVTPDSFSDGGKYFSAEDAIAQAKAHAAHGADFLDIGAESTRPGAKDIGHEEEILRLTPVLQGITALKQAGEIPAHCAVCVDTFRESTAQKAIELGVNVINDVSGGIFEPGILDVVAYHKVGFVLGHSPHKPQVMQQNPYYNNIIDALTTHFTTQTSTLVAKGLPSEFICLDPCIGFGKTLEHTLTIFHAIPQLLALGMPLYFGISNKSFIAAITGQSVEHRTTQTQVATVLLAQKGVYLHRVHNVQETVATRKMFNAFTTV